jgi:hypothetical protein
MAHERLAQTVEFGPEVMHPTIAFGTKITAIRTRRKLGWYADITAAEVMQQSVVREMRAPATGTDFAHVQVMAVAFGAEADSVEEARFEVVTPREGRQVPFDIIAARGIDVAVSGARLRVRRNLPAS